MSTYLAIVFCEFQQGSPIWNRVSRDKMIAIVSEYKYLAESIASQYGNLHQAFTSDGHLFLFDNADAAIQFCLKLIQSWKDSAESIPALGGLSHVPLRLGCHFGECILLEDGNAWVGRGINLVKQLAKSADPDTLCVTESILDVIDLPMHQFQEVDALALEGDYLPLRRLYRVTSLISIAGDSRPIERPTAELWFLKGVALIGTVKENSEEEADCYRQALLLRPEYAEAHNNLAVLLSAIGDERSAAERYREALTLRSDYPEAHYNYALLLQARGSTVGAAEHYQKALRLRRDYVDTHYGYATLLSAHGDMSKADAHYQEALRLRPEYAEVHNNYAMLLEDKGELEKAHRHYREALRIRPEYPEAHYNYAYLLENEVDWDNAEAHYRQALALRADYPEAHNNLAILLQRKGESSDAEFHYKEALRLRPDDPQAHYNLALLLKSKDDLAQADEHFRLAYELAPSDFFLTVQDTSESRDSAPDTSGDNLTQREIQVLRLIAVGKSNREIAEELVISLSTVAHHVTNILNKTGSSNRTEAAAYASRHGLVSR